MRGDKIVRYQEINAKMIDAWCENGWEWGKVITHEEYEKALNGEWKVRLTPTKYVPHAIKNEQEGKLKCEKSNIRFFNHLL